MRITSPSIIAPIDENSGDGQVVYTATSSDPGATYSLSGADAGDFEILAGVVTLKDDPVYATKPAYNFTVNAHDAAGNVTSKELTLDVVDKTAPVIGSGDPGSIDENSGVNQVVYTPTSQDASAVSYSIKQGLVDDADHFKITTVDVLDGWEHHRQHRPSQPDRKSGF